MAISAAHSAAARQNGKLSQGPATASGKARSSQNARKHNLLGSTVLLSCEDQSQFDVIQSDFLDEHKPETPTELRYIREMIDAEFRLQRVRSHIVSIQEARMRQLSETPTMDDAAEAFRQLAEEGPSLSLLQRYENQFRRQFDKALELFLDFRLRIRTDKEKIVKAQADAYAELTKALIDYPTPGELNPKSSTISFPKEPSPRSSPSLLVRTLTSIRRVLLPRRKRSSGLN